MKKLFVFDLDGTLVNSVYDIADALNTCLAELGKPAYPVEDYYRMVGDGMYMLCRRALPEGMQEEVDRLVAMYSRRYRENCCVRTCPYEGIPELLKKLGEQGVKLAILSNKPHDQAMAVVSTLLPEIGFFCVRGQSDDFPRKPDPAALRALIESAEVSGEETVYIGDSDVDVYFGKNAGVQTVGVSWGFRGEAELQKAGADRIAATPTELAFIFEEYL